MTAPLRRFLLNRQIATEARRIAHAATSTCHYEFTDGTDNNDEHTKNCNDLKHKIQALAMEIKLACFQQQGYRDQPPLPEVFNTSEEHHDKG